MWQNPHAGFQNPMQQGNQNPMQMLQQLQAQITQLRFQLNQQPNNTVLAQQLQMLEAQYNQLYMQLMQQQQQRVMANQPMANNTQMGFNQSPMGEMNNRFNTPAMQPQRMTASAQPAYSSSSADGNRFGPQEATPVLRPAQTVRQPPLFPDFQTTTPDQEVTEFQITDAFKTGEELMVEDKIIIVDCIMEGVESLRESYYGNKLKNTGLLRPITIVKPFYRVHKTRSAGLYKESNLIDYIHNLPVNDDKLNIHDRYFIKYVDEYLTQRINTFLSIHMGDEVYIDSAVNDIDDLKDFLKQPENKIVSTYWREFLKQEYRRLKSISELMESMGEEEVEEVFSAKETGTHVNFFATPVNMLYVEKLSEEVTKEEYIPGKYYSVKEETISDSIVKVALDHIEALKKDENEIRELVLITVDDHAIHFIENYQGVLYAAYLGNIC